MSVNLLENQTLHTDEQLPVSLASELDALAGEIAELRVYITTQLHDLLKKSDHIVSLITTLREYPHYPPHVDGVAQIFIRATQEYQQVTSDALQDANQYEKAHQTTLQTLQKSQEGEKEAQLNEIHVKNCIRIMRSRVKNDRKQLAIIFSRFDYGYDMHLARCKQLEIRLAVQQSSHRHTHQNAAGEIVNCAESH